MTSSLARLAAGTASSIRDRPLRPARECYPRFVLLILIACAPSAAELAPYVGDWHLDKEGDAELGDSVTLTLFRDLSFAWVVEGCDFSGGGSGVWTIADTSAVLTSATGSTFSWFHHPGYDVETREISANVVERRLAVVGITGTGETFEQIWETGPDSINCGDGAL